MNPLAASPHNIPAGDLRILRLMNQFDGKAISEASHIDLLHRFCTAAIESGYRMAAFALEPEEEGHPSELLVHAAADGEELKYFDLGWTALAESHVLASARSGSYSCQVANQMVDEPRYAPWRDEAVRLGYRSALSMRNFVDDGLPGSLVLLAEEPDAFGSSASA
jgi:hypothetical protein